MRFLIIDPRFPNHEKIFHNNIIIIIIIMIMMIIIIIIMTIKSTISLTARAQSSELKG